MDSLSRGGNLALSDRLLRLASSHVRQRAEASRAEAVTRIAGRPSDESSRLAATELDAVCPIPLPMAARAIHAGMVARSSTGQASSPPSSFYRSASPARSSHGMGERTPASASTSRSSTPPPRRKKPALSALRSASDMQFWQERARRLRSPASPDPQSSASPSPTGRQRPIERASLATQPLEDPANLTPTVPPNKPFASPRAGAPDDWMRAEKAEAELTLLRQEKVSLRVAMSEQQTIERALQDRLNHATEALRAAKAWEAATTPRLKELEREVEQLVSSKEKLEGELAQQTMRELSLRSELSASQARADELARQSEAAASEGEARLGSLQEMLKRAEARAARQVREIRETSDLALQAATNKLAVVEAELAQARSRADSLEASAGKVSSRLPAVEGALAMALQRAERASEEHDAELERVQCKLAEAQCELVRVQRDAEEMVREARAARDAAAESARVADSVAERLRGRVAAMEEEKRVWMTQREELLRERSSLQHQCEELVRGRAPRASSFAVQRAPSVVLRGGLAVPEDAIVRASDSLARPTVHQQRMSQASSPASMSHSEALKDVASTRSFLELTAKQARDARARLGEALERETALAKRLSEMEGQLTDALHRMTEAEGRADALQAALRRSRAATDGDEDAWIAAEEAALLAAAASQVEQERDEALSALDARTERQRRERREVLRAIEECRGTLNPLPATLSKLAERLLRRESRARIAEEEDS
jgi:hypothetical protein